MKRQLSKILRALGLISYDFEVSKPDRPIMEPFFDGSWTKGLEADFTELIDCYISNLLDTSPCDRERVESDLFKLYEEAAIERPKKIIWFESPAVVWRAALTLLWFDNEENEVLSEPYALRWWLNDRREAISPLAARVRSSFPVFREFNVLPTLLSEQVPESIIDRQSRLFNLGNTLIWSTYTAVRDELQDALDSDAVNDIWLDAWATVHEGGWPDAELMSWSSGLMSTISQYSRPEDIELMKTLITRGMDALAYGYGPPYLFHLLHCDSKAILDKGKQTELLSGLREMLVHCCWWWPFPNICLLVERPMEIHVNDNMRLHRHDQMSLKFRDGWGAWALDGVPVSESIARGDFTPADIDAEINIELQRVMIQRYGAARFLSDSGVEEIQRDECGVLYRKNLNQPAEPLVMVKVTNSTPSLDGTWHDYFIRVPPDVTTAREAVAWTFGMSTDEYRPDTET